MVGLDNGAVSDDGTPEATINLKITKKLKKLLEENGAKVIMTRENDEGLYNEDEKTFKQKKRADLQNRVKIGNESNADIFISIHLNKIPQKQYFGFQTFYKANNEKSKKLANIIQNSLKETIKSDNKREALVINNIYIIDHINIPANIVECGFLSNNEEAELLKNDEYQEKLAYGIYSGIIKYFTN